MLSDKEIREILDLKIRYEREIADLKVLYEREITDLRSNLETVARDLQAKEYERRLDTLNHAHEEAQRVLNTYIPRETFDTSDKELRAKIEALEKTNSMLAGRYAAIGLCVTIGLVILTIFMNQFGK